MPSCWHGLQHASLCCLQCQQAFSNEIGPVSYRNVEPHVTLGKGPWQPFSGSRLRRRTSHPFGSCLFLGLFQAVTSSDLGLEKGHAPVPRERCALLPRCLPNHCLGLRRWHRTSDASRTEDHQRLPFAVWRPAGEACGGSSCRRRSSWTSSFASIHLSTSLPLSTGPEQLVRKSWSMSPFALQ